MQAGGKLPNQWVGGLRFICSLRQHIHPQLATTAFERHFQRFQHASTLCGGDAEAVGHHIEQFARPGGRGRFALGLHLGKAAGGEPLRHLLGRRVGRKLHRKSDDHSSVAVRKLLHALQELLVNGVRAVMTNRQGGLAVKQASSACKQELEVVVQLGHGAHGGAAGAHRIGLVDGNGGRHTVHPVHRRFVHAV